jgi:hypothetical protein
VLKSSSQTIIGDRLKRIKNLWKLVSFRHSNSPQVIFLFFFISRMIVSAPAEGALLSIHISLGGIFEMRAVFPLRLRKRTGITAYVLSS